MKKLFLLLSLVALTATQGFSYDFQKYKNVYFNWMSPNGEWFAYYYAGLIDIYHVSDSQIYDYTGNETSSYYDLGNGNSVTDEGYVVGSRYYRVPAYWKDGEWHDLPLRDDITEKTYTMAMGSSPDGGVICGMINVNFGSTTQVNMIPAVWERNADGTYDPYEVLPYPETDFAGRVPRYVTARYVSDDGKTIYGEFLCPTLSLTTYPIVYRKGDDGKWTYKLYGMDRIYDTSVTFPKYPVYKPTYPSMDSYMTEEDNEAWLAAVDKWKELKEAWDSGLSEENPADLYPQKIDYCSNAEQYNNDVANYNTAYKAYSDSLKTWQAVYDKAVTGGAYAYNGGVMSGNAKYLTQTLTMPSGKGFKSGSYPVLISLDGEGTVSDTDADGMVANGVTNDGMIVAMKVEDTGAYYAYVVEAGSTEAQKFEDWVATKCEAAADWMNENMLYDVITWTEDPSTGDNSASETQRDVLVSGAMICNPQGTRFLTYVYDYWSDDLPNGAECTFYIDIEDPNVPTAIKAAVNKQEGKLNISAADGQISANGMDNIALYDMQGRCVATSINALNANVAAGIYLVKGTSADGSSVSQKVAVGK